MSARCVLGMTGPALVVKRKTKSLPRNREHSGSLLFIVPRKPHGSFFNNISSLRAPRHHESTDLLHGSESAVAAVRYRPRDRFPRHATTSENRIDRFAVWQYKILRPKFPFWPLNFRPHPTQSLLESASDVPLGRRVCLHITFYV